MLDDMHKRKIDMADRLYDLNPFEFNETIDMEHFIGVNGVITYCDPYQRPRSYLG